jgi:hypothetical protein
MINAAKDKPAGPSGPVEAAVAITTDNQTAQNAAKIADLAIPLALSMGTSPQWGRAATSKIGAPGTIAGTLERVPASPENVYPFLQAFNYADTALTVNESWSDARSMINAPPSSVVGPSGSGGGGGCH